MSQQVLWEVVKNNNAFLVKRNGHSFSTDVFNNTGFQTYSNTGFISKEAVSVQQGLTNHANNLRIQLRKKVKYQQKSKYTGAKGVQKNAKHTIYSVDLPVRHGVHTATKIIKKRFGTRRLGLQRTALKKLVLLNRANYNARRNFNEAAKAQKK